MRQSLPRIALMLGNLATGVSILAPAGMLTVLADGLGVGIRDTGLLVTFGAVILCFGSPLVAWLTTRFDRRLLLTVTLAVLVVGQVASAFATSYGEILVLRLVMLAIAAIFTPQAASTIAMIVPVKERAAAIAFVFLGWSLAVAAGLPLITLVAAHFGWREAYGVAALTAFVPCLMVAFTLPGRLRGEPLSLQSFAFIARHRQILLLLSITLLQMSGQFTVFIYLSPLMRSLTGASPDVIGLYFGIYGVAGFIGNVITARIVGVARRLGDVGRAARLGFRRHFDLDARRRLAGADGRRHRAVGARLCRHQFGPAGAAGGGGAGAVERDGGAQHLRALRRAGGRLRARRLPVCAGAAARRRLCRHAPLWRRRSRSGRSRATAKA